MWPVIFVIAVIVFLVWFARTPLFRAHVRGGKDPGFENTRMEGRFPRNGGSYYYGEKTRSIDDQ